MASVVMLEDGGYDIDYSVQDGRIRSATINGVTVFDEDKRVAEEGWKEKVVAFVVDQGLNIDDDGYGLHAFVYKLIDEGLVQEGENAS